MQKVGISHLHFLHLGGLIKLYEVGGVHHDLDGQDALDDVHLIQDPRRGQLVGDAVVPVSQSLVLMQAKLFHVVDTVVCSINWLQLSISRNLNMERVILSFLF